MMGTESEKSSAPHSSNTPSGAAFRAAPGAPEPSDSDLSVQRASARIGHTSPCAEEAWSSKADRRRLASRSRRKIGPQQGATSGASTAAEGCRPAVIPPTGSLRPPPPLLLPPCSLQ